MKQTIPPFKATGKVAVYQKGDFSPTVALTVTVITQDRWSIGAAMERSARFALMQMGLPNDKIEALNFEYSGTDELNAMEPKGVKYAWGERVEAFFDDGKHTPAKRATLIRQRRLLPDHFEDARAMYLPTPIKQEEAVAA